jgi:hypothetical protein
MCVCDCIVYVYTLQGSCFQSSRIKIGTLLGGNKLKFSFPEMHLIGSRAKRARNEHTVCRNKSSKAANGHSYGAVTGQNGSTRISIKLMGPVLVRLSVSLFVTFVCLSQTKCKQDAKYFSFCSNIFMLYPHHYLFSIVCKLQSVLSAENYVSFLSVCVFCIG